MKIYKNSFFYFVAQWLFMMVSYSSGIAQTEEFKLEIEQLTFGFKHHFFGYIGQCQTIPWNATGRYILALEIEAIDRMPTETEAAAIVLLDTHNQNKLIHIDSTRAWNPQQGTMFYWNPLAPDTQFFFNDKDAESGQVFTVLYDIAQKKRVREFRYKDTPIGNGGVASDGSAFLGLNYGRMARLRLVTGYPGAIDWSKDETAPDNDGVFLVNTQTMEKKLLVSFRALQEMLQEKFPHLNHGGLFINHTLWNRDATRVYFFVRAGWDGKGGDRVNVPVSIHTDGSGLAMHESHIGGHPEWDLGNVLIGIRKNEGERMDDQILYDVDSKQIVGQLGNADMFPKPEGDISLSPNGNMFVNGYSVGSENVYAVYRRSDGAFARSEGISKGQFAGDIRIDPAPRWNRTNDAILVPGIDSNNTRQLFVIRVIPKR